MSEKKTKHIMPVYSIEEQGEYFGYPPCCTRAFIKGEAMSHPRTDGSGFLMCATHHQELSDGLPLTRLFESRVCPAPFPYETLHVQRMAERYEGSRLSLVLNMGKAVEFEKDPEYGANPAADWYYYILSNKYGVSVICKLNPSPEASAAPTIAKALSKFMQRQERTSWYLKSARTVINHYFIIPKHEVGGLDYESATLRTPEDTYEVD